MIDTKIFNIQIARQTARGVYPANPTFLGSLTNDARISNAPSADTLNVGESSLWTPSFKRIGRIEAGGSPVIAATPQLVGLLLYGGLGAVATTGVADPYNHACTPAASSSSFPLFCIWQRVDNLWELFRDCIMTEITLEVSNSDRWVRVTPTFVSLQKGKVVAAPGTPASAETDVYHWLDGAGYFCLDGDFTNLDHSAAPTDTAGLITWLGNFKTKWNAHCAVATGRHHKAADAVNVLTYATPVADLDAVKAAIAEIKTDHEAHRVNTTVHYFADATNTLTFATPLADEAACVAAVQQILGTANIPGAYNAHLGAQGGPQSFRLRATSNAGVIYGQDVVPYAVQRKRGVIEAVMSLLMEDFRIYKRIVYGDPAAAAETEATTEIQRGSLDVKFTASTSGNERSIHVQVPQFDYLVESVAGLSGDPEGNEKYADVGGEASGTGTLVTVNVKNDVDEY